jgi:hypothetical protein
MKLKFGDRILVYGYIIRSRSGNKRVWYPIYYPTQREAIFLGKRTLHNGEMDYSPTDIDGESDYYFHSKERIPGACICRKGHKPENIFLSQIVDKL